MLRACAALFPAAAAAASAAQPLPDGEYSIATPSGPELQANDMGDHLVSTRFQSGDGYARFQLQGVGGGAYRIRVSADGLLLHADDLGTHEVETLSQGDDGYNHFTLTASGSAGAYEVRTAASGRAWYVNSSGFVRTRGSGAATPLHFSSTGPAPPAPGGGPAPPAVAWAKGYGNGGCEAHPHAGVQTRDGGFLMVGDSQCYDGSNAELKRMIFVVKTTADGTEEWTRRIGDVYYNYGKFAMELDDGTFLVAGAVSVRDAGSQTGYAERRALVRLARNGTVARATLFASAARDRLDGFMCVAPGGEPGVVVATGYAGGVQGYDEQPMFLIYGGQAFVTKLRFGAADADPEVLYDVRVMTGAGGASWQAVQGMRVAHDAANGVYAVSALAVPKSDTGHPEFAVAAFDTATGAAKWATFLPAQNRFHPGGEQSHPYAFTLAPGGAGYVVAGIGFEQGSPWGRAAKVAPSGTLEWDSRFRQNGTHMNTECYGVSAARDGGFVVTCGTGVEPEDHPSDPARSKIWMVLMHRTDAAGGEAWQRLYSSNAEMQDDAGEYVLTTASGGYAVLIDSQTWGPQGTGGNFGLMLLDPDD